MRYHSFKKQPSQQLGSSTLRTNNIAKNISTKRVSNRCKGIMGLKFPFSKSKELYLETTYQDICPVFSAKMKVFQMSWVYRQANMCFNKHLQCNNKTAPDGHFNIKLNWNKVPDAYFKMQDLHQSWSIMECKSHSTKSQVINKILLINWKKVTPVLCWFKPPLVEINKYLFRCLLTPTSVTYCITIAYQINTRSCYINQNYNLNLF